MIVFSTFLALSVAFLLVLFPLFGLMGALLIIFVTLFFIDLEYGILAIIFVIPWAWNSLAIQSGLISVKLSYVLITIAIAFFLYKLLIAKEYHWIKTPLDKGLLFFLAINLLSLVVAIDLAWSIKEFFQILLYIVTFFLLTNTLTTRQSINRAGKMLVLATTSLAIVGLLGLSGYKPEAAGSFSRVLAGFKDPNLLANFLLMGLPLALAFTLGENSLRKKIIYFMSLALIGAALLLTYSRAGWFTGIFIFMLVIYLTKSRMAGIAIMLSIFLVVGIFGFSNLASYKERATLDDPSTRTHVYYWLTAATVSAKHPLLGIGVGAFPIFFSRYQGTSMLPPKEIYGEKIYIAEKPGRQRAAHNALLQMWSEIGTVGLLAFLLVIGIFIKTMLSSIAATTDGRMQFILIGLFASVIGVLIHNLSITNLIDHFWMTLGIATAATRISALSPKPKT